MSSKVLRAAATAWLTALLTTALAANWIAPHSASKIFAEVPDQPPSRLHLLGTDAVCRDRFSRLIFGTRVALLAPAAAGLATVLAALAGGISGLAARRVGILLMFACQLLLALPWMFLLIAARAMLPLNTPPEASALVTFGLLALLGWAGAARVVYTRVRALVASDIFLLARAGGLASWRVLLVHVPPILRPVLLAQFWIAIPVFLLSEANLSLVGLGVADPMTSWGSLLRDFERAEMIASHPWATAPLWILISALVSAQILSRERQSAL